MDINFGKLFDKNQNQNITIRQAQNNSKDREAARALMQETFEYHAGIATPEPALIFKPEAQTSYMEECLATLIYGDTGQEPARAFLAFRKDKPVGFTIVRIMRDFYYQLDNFGYIEQLIVTKSERRNGIGGLLLDNCYVWLKSRGIKSATLKVYGTNDEAFRFYQREGFQMLRYELIKHI
jgi:ribosomal protein S18 acetylase RimI-like enzyme